MSLDLPSGLQGRIGFPFAPLRSCTTFVGLSIVGQWTKRPWVSVFGGYKGLWCGSPMFFGEKGRTFCLGSVRVFIGAGVECWG